VVAAHSVRLGRGKTQLLIRAATYPNRAHAKPNIVT